jgi:hypothetical protein
MERTTEYRGVSYSIPRNSDGVWTWIIHPHRRRRKPPQSLPRPTYASRAEAVADVERVIDAFLAEERGQRA